MYAWQYFFIKTMTNLWLRKFWLLISGFLIFSIQKYLYKSLGLTRAYITYLDVEEKWNDNNETAAVQNLNQEE